MADSDSDYYPGKRNRTNYRRKKKNAVLSAAEGMNLKDALKMNGIHTKPLYLKTTAAQRKAKQKEGYDNDYISDDELNLPPPKYKNAEFIIDTNGNNKLVRSHKQFSPKLDLPKPNANSQDEIDTKKPPKFIPGKNVVVTSDKKNKKDDLKTEPLTSPSVTPQYTETAEICAMKALLRIKAIKNLRSKTGKKEAIAITDNMSITQLMKLALFSDDEDETDLDLDKTRVKRKNLKKR